MTIRSQTRMGIVVQVRTIVSNKELGRAAQEVPKSRSNLSSFSTAVHRILKAKINDYHLSLIRDLTLADTNQHPFRVAYISDSSLRLRLKKGGIGVKGKLVIYAEHVDDLFNFG